jgi:hypothetical protein
MIGGFALRCAERLAFPEDSPKMLGGYASYLE